VSYLLATFIRAIAICILLRRQSIASIRITNKIVEMIATEQVNDDYITCVSSVCAHAHACVCVDCVCMCVSAILWEPHSHAPIASHVSL